MTNKCKECGKELTDFEKTITNLHKGLPTSGLCAECKFRHTEQKHGTAQAELDQIRAKARERNRRFMERKKSEGGRQLSAIVTKECYDTLTRIRDNAQQAGNPQSFGAIIEKALTVYVSTLDLSRQDDNISDATSVCSNDRINKEIKRPDNAMDPRVTVEAVDQEPEPSPAIKAIAEHVRENPSIIETQAEIPAPGQDKPDVIQIIANHRAAGDSWPTIADALNNQDILTARGGTWTKANAQVFYSRNK